MIIIEVCVGSSCYVKGSNQALEILKSIVAEKHLEDQVEIRGSFCMNMCSEGLGMKINGEPLRGLGVHNARELITKRLIEVVQ